MVYIVEISVFEGRHLPVGDVASSDPYPRAVLAGCVSRSGPMVRNSLDPAFGWSTRMFAAQPDCELEIQVSF
jgi:hypothetical protein